MHLKKRVYSLIYLLFFFSCTQQQKMLIATKQLPYPSGSSLSYLNGKLYLMGDDAVEMVVLDEDLNILDSIPIIDYPLQRIPKNIKPDIEASTVMRYQNKNVLFLIGSGSVEKFRNTGYIIEPGSVKSKTIDLSVFYNRIKNEGIEDLNVEGMTALPAGLVMASRGNKTFRHNFLVFTSQDFFEQQDTVDIKLVRVGTNADTSLFNGISGLDYAAGSDKLLLTVSSENTYNSYEDGSIGKSYLWIINDITTRKRFTHINPDIIIDLDKLDDRFKGHKIESVSIVKETRQQLHLVLVADDDNGQTLLFKMSLQKEK